MESTDTIAAIATPTGRGGVGIVRISGPKCLEIADKILKKTPTPRNADYCPFYDRNHEVIDRGIALYFKTPHSFTGEDVIELQGHGGPVVMDMLLSRVCELGARIAHAGEFSERAFLNDKIDLAQAEAIADLIEADSTEAARAAVRSMQGEFSTLITDLLEQLIQLRIYVEAALDFPEEEIDFLADAHVSDELDSLMNSIDQVLASARQGSLLREGMTVVIAGRPNAGKSSLLNALSGRESAIVTHIEGTTRDVLREHIQIDGMPLHVIDTAGLRETDDPVEQEGVRRAWLEIEKADRILLVVDQQQSNDDKLIENLPKSIEITRIYNKIDISGEIAGITQDDKATQIALSAKTGEGIDLLKTHLKQCMGFEQSTEGQFMARRRHLTALDTARQSIMAAQQNLKTIQAGELIAEELKTAQNALAEITGEFSSDDLLGRIFSSFCIGK
ncbi:MAG: tRNA uridine-5-carboxymethylaminomethyl(34) synthesis GTPase MnmE [Gammaproteobacteria bacterium]|nr:tRNA uridine-5-carboxymethylaminomethyl(34) synthesis GTPase MnmE [Gammaproteobacteria bacterium]